MNNTIGYTDGAGFIPFKNYSDIAQFIRTPVIQKENNKMPIRGFNYGYGANRGELRSEESIKSQKALYNLGINWVCLPVINYQTTYSSTDIHADYYKTPTDWDIVAFVNNARNHNLKICLKPLVNPEDNLWRAYIGFPDLGYNDMDSYWNKWFESYTNFILHYAELAQELKIEMLCIGGEMINTEHKEDNWKNLIQKVRNIYSGKIIYNTNHDREDAYSWFDELDYIATSAYYPVGENGIDIESMKKEWEKVKYRLDSIAKERNKKFIFMEIGCRSAEGMSKTPYNYEEEGMWNEEEQANFYQSCFETFKDDDNFAGMFWWDWPTKIYNNREEAESNLGFSIYFKKAEEIVKQFYKD